MRDNGKATANPKRKQRHAMTSRTISKWGKLQNQFKQHKMSPNTNLIYVMFKNSTLRIPVLDWRQWEDVLLLYLLFSHIGRIDLIIQNICKKKGGKRVIIII